MTEMTDKAKAQALEVMRQGKGWKLFEEEALSRKAESDEKVLDDLYKHPERVTQKTVIKHNAVGRTILDLLDWVTDEIERGLGG